MTDSTIGIVIDPTGAVSGAATVKRSLSEISQHASLAKSATEELAGALRKGLEAFGAYLAVREVMHATIELQSSQVRLAAALRATQGVSGQTIETLNEMGESLSNLSVYSKPAIASAQALMLTFNQIRGDTFPQAMDAVANLASALNMDLSSAAFTVGKALQSPANGLGLLARSVGGLDPVLERHIQRMAQTGYLHEAQAAILQILQGRFSGTAAAMRDTFGGALTGLKNQLEELQAGKGASLSDATDSIKELTDLLKDPDVAQGLATFTAGIFKMASGLTLLASAAVQAPKALGEFFASLFSKQGFDNSGQVQIEIDRQMELLHNLEKNKVYNPRVETAKTQVEDRIAELERTRRALAGIELDRARAHEPANEAAAGAGAKPKAGDITGPVDQHVVLKEQYDRLGGSLNVLAARYNELAQAQLTAKESAATQSELKTIADLYANNLVGGLDATADATQTLATQMAVIDKARPEVQAELRARAMDQYRKALEAATDSLGEFTQADSDLVAQKQLEIEQLGQSTLAIAHENEHRRIQLELRDRIHDQPDRTDELTQEAAATEALTQALIDQNYQVSHSADTGYRTALNDIAEVAANSAQTVHDMLVDAFDSIGDALARMAASGKLDFKSLVNSIILDLIRLETRQSFAKLLGFIAGAAGSGGGTAGSGSASSTVSTPSVSGSLQGVNLATGYDDGGMVMGPRGRDVVPAMLTAGEFVVNDVATRAYRPFLEAINDNKVPMIRHYADGGYVGGGNAGGWSRSPAPVTIHLNTTIDAAGADPAAMANALRGLEVWKQQVLGEMTDRIQRRLI